MNIYELRQSRLNHVTEMRALLRRADDEKRELTAEESEQYNKINDQIDALEDRINKEMRTAELEKSLGEIADPEKRDAARGAAGAPETADAAPAGEARKKAFRKYIVAGPGALNGEDLRALQMDSDTVGGFLVAPQDFQETLIQFVNNNVWMRQLASKFTVTNADSLGIPTLDTDPADADWTAELGTGNEDTAMAFGKRELRPHPLAKRIKLSNKLVRASALNPEGIVVERLGYKFAVAMEKAYLTGTGAGQPLGVFTASGDGIDTSRDVNSGNTSTAVGADNLFNVKYAVKQQYWGKGSWIVNRTVLRDIRKLKDSQNQYLILPNGFGTAFDGAFAPDRLLESPVYISEYAPNTMTTGLYVGIFGDFSRYWIADALTFQVQRLVELYAATNQLGLIGRAETDGMPVLAEAFARMTLA